MSWAASKGFFTFIGAWNPLLGVKKAGKSVTGPKDATQTPWVSWKGKKIDFFVLEVFKTISEEIKINATEVII